jgi:cardiolipin synthase
MLTYAERSTIDPLEALSRPSFRRVASARLSSGNRVRLLRDGPETFAAWLEAIDGASRFVDLENYILEDDATGARFADALIAAAGRGVRCRVIYDWLGCLTRTSRRFWNRLRDAGVAVCPYNVPLFSNPLHAISRDHRKVLVVDGEVAFTGGLCIGHDWMGDPARGIPPWRDTAIELRGPVVADVRAAFEDSWAAAHRQTTPGPPPASDCTDENDDADGVEVSVIAGRPGTMGLYRLEQLVAEVAQRSLWLTDGYFVATTAYVHALTGAARAGVDVRLLVPGSSNWPLVGALSKSAYRPLLEAGVRVFEWNGPMVHAKTAVVDGKWTRIGSSNSNLASWISNRELDVTIADRDLAAQMEAMFEQDLDNATEVVMGDSQTWVGRPTSLDQGQDRNRSTSSKRLLSGAIGLGSTVTATLLYRRAVGPAESLAVLGGGVALIVLGLIVLALPHVFAWIVAIVAIWGGIDVLLRAARMWRTGTAKSLDPTGKPG